MHDEMVYFPPHTKLLLYLWTLQRLSNMDAELLLAEMLMSVWTGEKADAELLRSLSRPS